MWNEILVQVKPEDCDRACDALTRINSDGMYVEDFSDLMENAAVVQTKLVDEDLLARVGSDSIIHLYIAPTVSFAEETQMAEALLQMNHIPHKLSTQEIPEKNWNEEWMKYYKPVPISDTLTIVPCWMEYQPRAKEQVVLLDPGVAFGTGTHETTKLCLTLLEKLVCPGDRIRDIGTGSGIRAVTSLLLGAGCADAIDIDPLAVDAAKKNAALNGVQDRLRAEEGDLLQKASGQYQLICANIVADVIIGLLAQIKPFLAPGGSIILSGILASRTDDVLSAVSQNGFLCKGQYQDKEWTALLVQAQ